MVSLFKRKSSGLKKSSLQFMDLEGQPLKEGDVVLSLRYDLGECRIVKTGEGMIYESLKTGEQVSWAKMIDAATGYQKVRKLES